MAQATAAPTEMLPQLEAARKLVLGDAHFYTQIIPGILPIIGPSAPLEVRRWGAEFLAETFASPALGNTQKEELSSVALPLLRSILNLPGEDAVVVKSVVQAAASIYPLVFRKSISHPEDLATWQTMVAVKSNILKRMDTAPAGIRVCCIKFIQKVVQVHTPGLIADPRRPEQNETSISLVPRNHPFLSLPSLEAEASGLLDRLLNVFQENLSDPIPIDATMNCVAVLVRTRAAVANKIITALLNFNPLKQANSPMTPRLKVMVRSMERTTRALLKFINKTNPNGPLAGKIDAYLVRLNQSRQVIFADTHSLKRPAPIEPTGGLDDAKRQKLTRSSPRKYPPLPPPPNSVAQLFTLADDAGLTQFDVKMLPIDLINTITALTLQHVDQHALDEAVGVIRARYVHLQKMQRPTPVPDVALAGPTGIDDEDDYDPEYEPENGLVAAAEATQAIQDLLQPDIALGPFELPKPPPLTKEEVEDLSEQTVTRFVENIDSFAVPPQTNAAQKFGLNRLAASTNDRDAWVTVLTRLATRAPSGLDELVGDDETDDVDADNQIKPENEVLTKSKALLAENVRNGLYEWFTRDFRTRLNVAISWLTEEWYNDRLHSSSDPTHLPNYSVQTLRILEHLLIFLDTRDSKLLIRFLSEIPHIDSNILARVKTLAEDPERVSMCVMAMQYLIMMRPPVRTLVIDTVEQIWRDEHYAEAKAAAEKVLRKWRPEVVEESNTEGEVTKEEKQEGTNGVGDRISKAQIDPRKQTKAKAPAVTATATS